MITACVCFRKSFSEIKSIATENNLKTIREVIDTTRCGTKCRKCIPYMRQMLETGKTQFEGTLFKKREIRKGPRPATEQF